MPIYEYVCVKCGNEFELLVFKNDVPECPKCGAKDPQRKMSAFGFSVGHKFTSSSRRGPRSHGSGWPVWQMRPGCRRNEKA